MTSMYLQKHVLVSAVVFRVKVNSEIPVIYFAGLEIWEIENFVPNQIDDGEEEFYSVDIYVARRI